MSSILFAAAAITGLAHASGTLTTHDRPLSVGTPLALVPTPEPGSGRTRRSRGGASSDFGVGASLGLMTASESNIGYYGAANEYAGVGLTWGLALGAETDIGRVSGYYRRAGTTGFEMFWGLPEFHAGLRSHSGGLAWRPGEAGDVRPEFLAGAVALAGIGPGGEFGVRVTAPGRNRSNWTTEPGVVVQMGEAYNSIQFELRMAVWSGE